MAKPEQSNEIHEQLMAIQCELIGQLGLHARYIAYSVVFTSLSLNLFFLLSVLDMPAHDLGASAYRKFGKISRTLGLSSTGLVT